MEEKTEEIGLYIKTRNNFRKKIKRILLYSNNTWKFYFGYSPLYKKKLVCMCCTC